MKEFSKKMVFIPWVPFLFILGLFAYLILNGFDFTDIHQYIFIALISATGGIAATTNVWYLKKSQAENVYKVKLSLYNELSQIELDHLEKSLKLKQKYGEYDNDSCFPSMRENAFEDLVGDVDSAMSEATQPIEKENVD